MDVCEVYSINVMPQDIAHFLGCSRTDEEIIGSCREDFLNFMLDKEKQGMVYSSQLRAWNQYKEWQNLYSSPEEFEHLDVDEAEILDMSWTEELEMILQGLIKPGNYNEYMGQQ